MSRIGRLTPAAIAIVLGLLLAACSQQRDVDAPARSRIRISGSGPALQLLKVLASEYEDPAVEFVFLSGLHSAGGIDGVAHGDLEIGTVSRDLTEQELSLGLDYTPLADDALAVVVHPSCQVTGLTSQQVRDIYAGRYRTWRELGGADVPIAILDRNEDESAKIVFRRHVLGPSLLVTTSAGVLALEPDMIEAVASTPGAIGYCSMGAAMAQGARIRVLDLDGVSPTVGDVYSGKYPVVRTLGVVMRPDAPDAVDRFIRWAAGPEGRVVIERHGYAAAR